MRWYSVKKYRPPENVPCLVTSSCNYGYGFVVATFEDGVWCYMNGSNENRAQGVTHFCIPDPVEINE